MMDTSRPILETLNSESLVPLPETNLPEYCYKLNQFDFELKRNKRNKRLDEKYQLQRRALTILLTALLNTCGGLLCVVSGRKVAESVIQEWKTNLAEQLHCIPRWIFRQCLSIVVQENTLVILAKGSPLMLTLDTHFYIRSSEARSDLASQEDVQVVLQRTKSTGAASLRCEPNMFKTRQRFKYGEGVPGEDMWTENKMTSAAGCEPILDVIRKHSNNQAQCLSLPNNAHGGIFVFGAERIENTETYLAKGVLLPESEFFAFKDRLSAWLVEANKTKRIWGDETYVPSEGNNWNLHFRPVDDCPGGEHRVLIVIEFFPCVGGLFLETPECYSCTDSGKIKLMSLSEWRSAMSEHEVTNVPIVNDIVEDKPRNDKQLTNVLLSDAREHIDQPNNEEIPDLTQEKTAPGGYVWKPKPDVRRKIRSTQSLYDQVTWSKTNNWREKVNMSKCLSDAVNLQENNNMVEMQDPINITPAKDQIVSMCPNKADEIMCMFDTLENYNRPIQGLAFVFPQMFQTFAHDISIEKPHGHILDVFLAYENATLYVVCVFDKVTDANRIQCKIYVIQLCRLIKKHIQAGCRVAGSKIAVSFQVIPKLYYCAHAELVEPTASYSSLLAVYEPWSSKTEGVSMNQITSSLLSMLMTMKTSIRNRIGRQMSYTLTRNQIKAVLDVYCHRFTVIEGAPGTGKSVVVNYLCDTFTGKVLYISPAKGFVAYIKYMGKADAEHVPDEDIMREVIQRIKGYNAIIIDDVQALPCSESVWLQLFHLVQEMHQLYLVLLLDSRFQDYLRNGVKAKSYLEKFCCDKSLYLGNIVLTQVLRNSKMVYSFMKTQIIREEGRHLHRSDLTCGQQMDGDEVAIQAVSNLHDAGSKNGLLPRIQRLIIPSCPDSDEEGMLYSVPPYNAKDITVLVDHPDPTQAENLAKFYRQLLATHFNNVSVHDACQFSVNGITVDTVDNFLGQETTVGIFIISNENDPNRTYKNPMYRAFLASRCISRMELLFSTPFGTNVTDMMGVEDLSKAISSYTSSERPPLIAIDFGSTYCRAAIYKDEHVQVIPNDEGHTSTPSCVAFTETGHIIGSRASSQQARNFSNTIFDVKRILLKQSDSQNVKNNKEHLPFEMTYHDNVPHASVIYKGRTEDVPLKEVAAMILGAAKEAAETYMEQAIAGAVITVPSMYTYMGRRAIIEAAEYAGLEDISLISETSAAALTYSLNATPTEKNILVFSIGGGMLSVAVACVEDGRVEIKSVSGYTRLGGVDFDKRLVDHIEEDIKQRYNKRCDKRAICRLYTECRNAKHMLSSCQQCTIEIDHLFERINYKYTLTRTKFEELNDDLIDDCLVPVERALREAYIAKSKIDDVVMVGGSSRIPRIQEKLQSYFSHINICRQKNADEAVIHGTAIMAAIRDDKLHTLLLDVIPYSLGLQTAGNVMTPVMKRNSSYPMKKTFAFTTYTDNQSSLSVDIYEGELSKATDNLFIGRLILEGIDKAPAGKVPVKVTFDTDKHGLLTVRASCKRGGCHEEITL